VPRIPGLTRSDLRRLERLARQAGTTPARVLRAVLRDGFDYTEWFVRRVNDGEADLKAGRVSSTTAVLARSRANLRRLRAAHTEIETGIARRRIPGSGASGAAPEFPVERYTAKRVREFDRAEAALGKTLRRPRRRRAAMRGFLGNAGRVAAAGVRALSEDEIQAEIEALRKARRKPRRAGRGR